MGRLRTNGWRAGFLILLLLLVQLPGSARAQENLPPRLFLPLITASSRCQANTGENYTAITVEPPPTDRPAAEHADLNLALRSYTPTDGFLGLVDYTGATDPLAPQLYGLFSDERTGQFTRLHRVYDWNWTCNCRGGPLAYPPVTLAELATAPGELIRVPNSGYTIGGGYEVLVLYATPERITLKYTRNDNVVHGFTLHLEGVCIDPHLLALYQASNAAGRGNLPALRAGQAVGRAEDDTIGVAIRDSGTFLDPRSRKDWWRGR